jgi:hypothetical protein
VDDPGQDRLFELEADFLPHLPSKAVVGPFPAFEQPTGGEPLATLRLGLDPDEDDGPAVIVHQTARGPERCTTADPEGSILRSRDPGPNNDGDATETGEGVAHPILAFSRTHRNTEDGNLIKEPSEFPAAHMRCVHAP